MFFTSQSLIAAAPRGIGGPETAGAGAESAAGAGAGACFAIRPSWASRMPSNDLSSGPFASTAVFSEGETSPGEAFPVRIAMPRSLSSPTSLAVKPDALRFACSARLSTARSASNKSVGCSGCLTAQLGSIMVIAESW